MSDSDDSGSEEEEQYPPWLQPAISGEYFNQVKVVEEEDDDSQPGYIRCKEIIVPDTRDAADGKAESEIRRCTLKKFTTVLIVATPEVPPYIGLIDKIWREAGAQPLPGTTDTYVTSNFQLECYWFYRPAEWPANCWQFVSKPGVRGARFTLPGAKQATDERPSQRMLLFSSHHTMHDYPDLNGLQSLEGFLQTCKMHWLGLDAEPPERFAIHRGSLVRRREPGFIVAGFLWCNSKSQPQLHADDKRAFDLGGEWADPKGTMKIVKRMVKHYQKTAKRLSERNAFIKDKFERLAAQKARGEIADIPSDDGEDVQQQQQQQQQQQPSQQQQQPSQQQQQPSQQQQQSKPP